MISRRRFLSISAAFAATPASARASLRWSGIAFGAEVFMELHGPRAQTRPALDTALVRIRQIEALFSLHNPSSFLARLNRTGQADTPPKDVLDLFALSDRVHRLTDGLFDPSVQPLWMALARGDDPEAARKRVGWDRVEMGKGEIRLAKGQSLTFNGIAQGFATDAVIEVLERHGLTNLHVNIGEHATRGRPRRLVVSDPVHGPVGTTTITQAAIATSSPAATPIGPLGHILSPTGAAPRWSTISVQASSAALADGLSTALCLAEKSVLQRIAKLPGILEILAVDNFGDVSSFRVK